MQSLIPILESYRKATGLYCTKPNPWATSHYNRISRGQFNLAINTGFSVKNPSHRSCQIYKTKPNSNETSELLSPPRIHLCFPPLVLVSLRPLEPHLILLTFLPSHLQKLPLITILVKCLASLINHFIPTLIPLKQTPPNQQSGLNSANLNLHPHALLTQPQSFLISQIIPV